MLQPIQFAVQSTKDESLPGKATARLFNMYPEIVGDGLTLRSAPGLIETADVGPGQVEAMISAPEGIYMAVGGAFKLWNTTALVSTLGNIPQGDTTMARNRTQIAVVSGRKYHVWDGASIGPIDLPFSNVGSVSFLSNYFLMSEELGQAFAYTLDADTIDGLNFASAEYQPDNLRRIMVANDLIWMMGAETVEPWQVTGAATLPFSRISGAVKEKGLRSTLEAVVLDNTLFWVSHEGRMYRMGDTGQIVTTDAMCAALEGRTGRMMAFQQRRHDFAVARLTGRAALVFDPSTGQWWERGTGVCHDEWDVTATVHHEGVWYGGTRTGKLVTFGGYQDLGEPLRREVISSNITQGGNRFSVDRVHLRVSGSGNVMTSYSTDGGRTFSNERQRAFGSEFEYPIELNRLGVCRQFCLKVAMTDNAEFSIHEAGIEIS